MESVNNVTFVFLDLLSPCITSVQYCGGCSVLWGDSINTCGGIESVHVGG